MSDRTNVITKILHFLFFYSAWIKVLLLLLILVFLYYIYMSVNIYLYLNTCTVDASESIGVSLAKGYLVCRLEQTGIGLCFYTSFHAVVCILNFPGINKVSLILIKERRGAVRGDRH